MKSIVGLALLVLVAPGALAGDEIPFADYGKSFLEKRVKSADVAQLPVEKLREQHCVHGAFGAFEIAYPVWSLGDKQRVEDLRSLVIAILQMQSHWIDWLAKGDKSAEPYKGDAEALIAWAKGWKPAAFAKLEGSPERDLFVLGAGGRALQDASSRLAKYVLDPSALGVAPKNGEVLHVLFAPSRRDFVEMLGYSGLVDPALQTQHWNKNATTWTTFWIGWTFVMALEYPPWVEDKDFKTGLSMSKFEPTGMLQHTIQQVMLSFLWLVYGDNDALYLNQAMAMNMAIEICGEVNALEGEGGRGTTGAKTDPYEKFVPGGNSEGGTLPAIPAGPMDGMKTNFWHEGLGRDHFAGCLRKGQKAALKQMQKDKPAGLDPVLAKDKGAHFVITSVDGLKKYVVSAPFLGPFSKLKRYPPLDVLADYKEFFRAYKCGFYHWMQSQGDKAGPEASAAKYTELMKRLATRDASKKYEDVVLELYGVPLSGKNGETDSLEWRFLDWLAKGK